MLTTTLTFIVNIKSGSNALVTVRAPVTQQSLPLQDKGVACVLQFDRGSTRAGLYIANDSGWQLVLPYEILNDALLSAKTISVYYNLTQSFVVPDSALVFVNGGQSNAVSIPALSHLYWVIVTSASGSDVSYLLPVANALELGGVKVGVDTGLVINNEGLLSLDASVLSKPNIFRGWIPQQSSGQGGVLYEWIADTSFSINNFDGSAVTIQDPPDGEVTFNLRVNGTNFAILHFPGSNLPLEVLNVMPTDFVPGDVLGWNQNPSSWTLGPMTLLITDKTALT